MLQLSNCSLNAGSIWINTLNFSIRVLAPTLMKPEPDLCAGVESEPKPLGRGLRTQVENPGSESEIPLRDLESALWMLHLPSLAGQAV